VTIEDDIDAEYDAVQASDKAIRLKLRSIREIEQNIEDIHNPVISEDRDPDDKDVIIRTRGTPRANRYTGASFQSSVCFTHSMSPLNTPDTTFVTPTGTL